MRDPAEAMAERLNELSPYNDFIKLVDEIKQKHQLARQRKLQRYRRSSSTKNPTMDSEVIHPLGFHVSATAKTVIVDSDGHVTTLNADNKVILVPIIASTPKTTSDNDVLTKEVTSKKNIPDYASLVPLPITKICSSNAEMSQERLERQKLLLAFEQDIKQTERFVRQARKERKKEKRRYRAQLKQRKLLEEGNDDPLLSYSTESNLQPIQPRKMTRHAAASLQLKKISKIYPNSSQIEDIYSEKLSKIETDLSRKLMIVHQSVRSDQQTDNEENTN
jgi:hypothetical protein